MTQSSKYPFYRGSAGSKTPATPANVPSPRTLGSSRSNSYLPDPGLIDAVNVALLLAQPLLVTGEPGTGKTQLAYSLARELGFGEALRFDTKSTSTARDLFYVYNAVGRFHAAQTGSGTDDDREYITYNALGKAILRTVPAEAVQALTTESPRDGPQRSVVLIDEIDKAPRDFPNDILNEIEEMVFRVPELGNVEVRAADGLRPIVIITSNSEKHLPDAFLRRCIYYHIEFPDRQRLEDIALVHLAGTLEGINTYLSDALDLFMNLRSPAANLRKKPATAELLNWLVSMHSIRESEGATSVEIGDIALRTLGTLTKTPEDRETAQTLVRQWLDSNSE